MKPLTIKQIGLFFFAPLFLYFFFFALYTWPWLPHFSTHFFADAGDGLQNAWNIWWTNKALTGPDALWFTTYLHVPDGTPLFGHTLTPINGIIATALLPFLSLAQTYNTLVIFSFIGTGLTAFWLCYTISKSYWGSLLGGFVFTFSSYHFAHAIGHMNLISLEFMPLFLLTWWLLITKGSYWHSLFAAVSLALVTLSDLYYLVFSVIAAVIILAFHLRQIKWRPLFLFTLLAFALAAPVPLAVLWHNHLDPLVGAHNAGEYGANLISPFIPSEIWRWNLLTKGLWERDHLDIVEGSINLSFVLWGAIVAAVIWRKKLPTGSMTWFWLALIFAILSFGPFPHILRHSYPGIPLPYRLLAAILPPLKLAGVTVRMLVMTHLAAAVILSLVVAQFKLKKAWPKILLAAMGLIIIIECWPAPLPLTPIAVPEAIIKLKELPPGAVIDQLSSPSEADYAQTVHGHPIVDGYLARLPVSVHTKDVVIDQLVEQQQFDRLDREFGVKYLLRPAKAPVLTNYKILYQDAMATLYGLDK
jgi:hypothetical protein